MKRTAVKKNIYVDDSGEFWLRCVYYRTGKRHRTWKKLRGETISDAVDEAALFVAEKKHEEIAKAWIKRNGLSPNADFSTLPECLKKHGLEVRRMELARNRACVYFLMKGPECVYVGKTENSIYSRLSWHVTDKMFDHVYYIEVNPEELISAEAAYIARLKPVYNKTVSRADEFNGATLAIPKVDK